MLNIDFFSIIPFYTRSGLHALSLRRVHVNKSTFYTDENHKHNMHVCQDAYEQFVVHCLICTAGKRSKLKENSDKYWLSKWPHDVLNKSKLLCTQFGQNAKKCTNTISSNKVRHWYIVFLFSCTQQQIIIGSLKYYTITHTNL